MAVISHESAVVETLQGMLLQAERSAEERVRRGMELAGVVRESEVSIADLSALLGERARLGEERRRVVEEYEGVVREMGELGWELARECQGEGGEGEGVEVGVQGGV